ncbi:MAG: hypothetical protein CMJ78_22725 [Planctomycetaceae bacterium]|nr:hypothetical protein [Planctomycetaceae bacterium]
MRNKMCLSVILSVVCVVGCGGPVDENSHKIAQWAIDAGGKLTIADHTLNFSSMEDLPADAFGITGVDLQGTKIKNEDLEQLVELKSIRYLGLHSTTIDDAAISTIVKLKSLERLELSNTLITDKGLKQLDGLPKLRKLYISNTAATQEGVDALKKKLQNCEVMYF